MNDDPTERRRSRGLTPIPPAWTCLGIVVFSAALFWKAWDAVTEHGTTVRADRSIVNFAVHHRTPWLTDLARAWTLVGSAWVVTPVVILVVVVLLTRHRVSAAVIVVASSVGAALLVAMAKAAVARPRPPVGDRLVSALGDAFPSGHSAQSVACYSAVVWAVTAHVESRSLRTTAWLSAALIALGVGWSRVYLGVHWPSDVLGGWALAAGWLATLVLADLLRHRHRTAKRPVG